MVKNSCRKCGITEYNCHSFRHTFISNLIRGGVPLPVVESVSGDTQETILKRYSHMFASDDAMVLDVMSNL
jgi:integrase